MLIFSTTFILEDSYYHAASDFVNLKQLSQ